MRAPPARHEKARAVLLLLMSFEVILMSSVCEAVVLILMLLVIKCLFFEVKIDFDVLNSN